MEAERDISFNSEAKDQCGWFEHLEGVCETGGYMHACSLKSENYWYVESNRQLMQQKHEYVIYLTTMSVTQNI
jgi:hypothetical protein